MGLNLQVHVKRNFAKGPSLQFQLELEGEQSPIIALLGESGSGKTTLLRCLAGLEAPDEGWIRFEKEIWFDHEEKIHVSPQARKIGYVSQDYALFPHLTVRENIQFGLSGKRFSEKQVHDQASSWIQFFGIQGLEDRYPHQISGGQKQRVAFGRSLATQPRMLLLDEPFSALDSQTKKRIKPSIHSLLHELKIPVLWVTHDEEEAHWIAKTQIVLPSETVIHPPA